MSDWDQFGNILIWAATYKSCLYCRLSRRARVGTIVIQSAAQFGTMATSVSDLPLVIWPSQLGSTSPLTDPRLDMTFTVEHARLIY